MRLRIVNLFFLLSLVLGISAQPVCDVRTFTLRDGLAAHNISAIGQTGDDLMWFSTWNGLCCFDGYDFQTFRSQPGDKATLSSNRIQKVCPNSRNDLWCISYDHHIYLFDTHYCQFHDIEALIKKTTGKDFLTRTVFPLSNGRTWIVGNAGYGSFVVTDSLISSGEGLEKYSPRGSAKGDIMKVFLDQYGEEWIFTDKGVSTLSGSKIANIVGDYFSEIDGNIVISSHDAHVLVFGKNDQHGRQLSVDGATVINDMQNIGNHRVALATDKGVISVDIRTGATKMVSIGCEAKKINVDHKGRLWVFGSAPGVSLLSNNLAEVKTLHAVSLDPMEKTSSEKPIFLEESDGTVWLVPEGETFCYYDEASGKLVPYVLRSPIFPCFPFPKIDRYLVDRQGNLWFTGGHMLVLTTFSKQKIQMLHVIDNDDARSVLTLHDGNTAIGMFTGELALVAPDGHLLGYINSQGAIQAERTALSDKIYALAEDSQHRLWIGSKGDGVYIRSANGQIQHFKSTGANGSLPSNDIYDFDIDPKGRIWIATYEKGPCIVDEKNGSISFLTIGNGIVGYPKGKFLKVRRITHRQDGTMFLSTNEGLVVMREVGPGKFQCFTSTHQDDDTSSLITGDVMQTLVTRSGETFVITAGGGIQRLVDKNVFHDDLQFESIDSLNNIDGLIQSAIEDYRGNIWIIRETNADCYNPVSGKVVSYSQGPTGNQFSFSEALPVSSNNGHRLTIAIEGGAITFRPEQLTKSSFVPKIVFTSIRFQGEEKLHPILNTKELDVPSDKRNVIIHFAALDYRDNYGIRYAYKIEGKDKDWNYISKGNVASFNNLPHGHLKLLVRSTNSDGVWTNNITVLHIYSHPTFWETGWATLLYIIILCCLIALGIYIYTLRSKIKSMVDRWTDHLREMRERRARLSNPEVVDPDEQFINKLKAYLEQHIDDTDMKVENLAEAMNMGRSAFQTKVKELTGMSPIDYLTTARIERACYLLKNSSDNINQIAYAVGYSDPKYFSRVFKRIKGVTPSKYKNEEDPKD